MLDNILIELLWANQYKGVVYTQANANHHTFWSNVDMQKVEEDFSRLEEIGFNSIVLKPNWGDFVPEIHFWNDPDKVFLVKNKGTFNKLDLIVDIANFHNISIFIMPGVGTVPKLYVDNGKVLSTEVYTENYWVSFSEFLPREPSLYEHPMVHNLWDEFHGLIAKKLSSKTNIGGYIIEPETSAMPRELTSLEIQRWISSIRKVDPKAIIGYTPRINFTNETCNVPRTDVVFLGSYPSDLEDVLYANNILIRANLVRKFTKKPIVIRETGVSTLNGGVYSYYMTEKDQAIYFWTIEQLLESQQLGIIGYNLWCLSDFLPNSFGPPSDWTNTQSNFGLFRIDGSEKPVVSLLRNLLKE